MRCIRPLGPALSLAVVVEGVKVDRGLVVSVQLGYFSLFVLKSEKTQTRTENELGGSDIQHRHRSHSLSFCSVTVLPTGCRRACTGETAGRMWAALVAATDPAAGHASGCQPGSPIPGILQARTLEWVAIPSPGDLPNPGIEPRSPALQAVSLRSVSSSGVRGSDESCPHTSCGQDRT